MFYMSRRKRHNLDVYFDNDGISFTIVEKNLPSNLSLFLTLRILKTHLKAETFENDQTETTTYLV